MKEQTTQQLCSQCGAKLPPGFRYCVSCYHAVPGVGSLEPHTGSASVVSGTRRADPTVVFLPEEHEAMLKRRNRRKKTLLISGTALLIIAASWVVWLVAMRETPAERQSQARERMAVRELAILAAALEHFKTDVGRYPSEREGIISLRQKPVPLTQEDAASLSYWSGPYIEVAIEVDPWGNDYVYRITDNGGGFELLSAGPAGEDSGNVHLRITSQGKSADASDDRN